MTKMKSVGAYHYAGDLKTVAGKGGLGQIGAFGGRFLEVNHFAYDFQNFFHPWAGRLIRRLKDAGVAGLLDPAFLSGLKLDFFWSEYGKAPAAGLKDRVSATVYPKTIDLSVGGPYTNYNWELFYHIPVMVAVHLSNNQRFAEAQEWFHLVFDPTSSDTATPTPERYWRFLAFRGDGPIQDIDALLRILSTPDAGLSAADLASKRAVTAGYDAMLHNPFSPHAVARTRPSAYQWYIVMRYLDNLIAWGDTLFMQDTIETINEATLCYVLAAELLGPRPEMVASPATAPARSFAQLKAAGLDPMGNALVALESQFPFNSTPAPTAGGGNAKDQSGALFGIGKSLYFGIPPNPALLAYWDTVADRLFKIRNSENIQGVPQVLPLFDPPLDPGMLVQAAAAGIDIGGVLSGLNQPLGPVRAQLLIQKSLELASEVRQLGGALLSALEKGDSETLTAMRQDHEVAMQRSVQTVRYLQWQHARETTEGLLKTRATALERYTYYLRLLGQTPDSTAVPATLPLDRRELTDDNFADAYGALVGAYNTPVALQAFAKLTLAGGSSPSNKSGASGSGQLYLNSNENLELNVLMPLASAMRTAAGVSNTVAAGFYPIPSAEAHLAFWGMGIHSKLFSGEMLAAVTKAVSDGLMMVAGIASDQAAMAARTAGYQRRADDWALQANLAARELMQVGRQILASLIAEQMAKHDYETAKTQVAQNQEVRDFLRSKFTNAAFYGWMQGDLSGLYYQYYRFACDTARKAEQTMKRELMRPELDQTSFVQFNYWDTGHKGLLSGEALYLDVKRMELAYHENNKRELELTRHVSLRQLNPLALVTLKITGSCAFDVPEWLFDRDCSGHYMRRIKSVALSLPSVVGPYTSLNATLTLQRSTVRTAPALANGHYARDASNPDPRFTDYFGGGEMIVTSSGTNDAGLFETNLRDDRFLPFEGAGAVSSWTLSLPSDLRGFDYLSISDAILHIRYTARAAGDTLAAQAAKELKAMLGAAAQPGQALLFCLRNDFPTEWAAFVNDPSGTANFAAALTPNDFPYVAQCAKTIVIDGFSLYAPNPQTPAQVAADAPPPPQTLSGNPLPFSFTGTVASAQLSLPADTVLVRQQTAMVYLLVQYHLKY